MDNYRLRLYDNDYIAAGAHHTERP